MEFARFKNEEFRCEVCRNTTLRELIVRVERLRRKSSIAIRREANPSQESVEIVSRFCRGCLDVARHDDALMSFVRMKLSIVLAVLLASPVFGAGEGKGEKTPIN